MAIRPIIKSEDNYLSKLIKYIPSEIVAAYISLRAIVSDDTVNQIMSIDYYAVIFYLTLIITPIYTYVTTYETDKEKPIFHTVAATIAFVFWVYALGDYFAESLNNFHDYKLAAILLIFVTLVIPLAEKIFLNNKLNDVIE